MKHSSKSHSGSNIASTHLYPADLYYNIPHHVIVGHIDINVFTMLNLHAPKLLGLDDNTRLFAGKMIILISSDSSYKTFLHETEWGYILYCIL